MFQVENIFLGFFKFCFSIFFTLSNRKLRTHYSQKCIFNLALALLSMYVIFVLNASLSQAKVISTTNVACILFAALLHYSILTSFMWMFIMGVIQYIMFVKIYPSYLADFTVKACLICWGRIRVDFLLAKIFVFEIIGF